MYSGNGQVHFSNWRTRVLFRLPRVTRPVKEAGSQACAQLTQAEKETVEVERKPNAWRASLMRKCHRVILSREPIFTFVVNAGI